MARLYKCDFYLKVRVLLSLIIIITYCGLHAQSKQHDIKIKIKVKYFTNIGVFTTTVSESSFNDGSFYIIPKANFSGPQFRLDPAYNIIEGGKLSIDEGAVNEDLYLELILDSLNLNSGFYAPVFDENLFLKMSIDVYRMPDSVLVDEPYYFNEDKFFTACFPKNKEFLTFVEDSLNLNSDSLLFAYIEQFGFSTKGIKTFISKGKREAVDSICFSAVHLSKFGGGRGNLVSTGIKNLNNSYIPASINLYQNYPNPFNPETKIRYDIPTLLHFTASGEKRNGDGLYVTLIVYDILGREVATLVNEAQSPGTYEVSFNAGTLPSGIYIYRLEAGNTTLSKLMVLLK